MAPAIRQHEQLFLAVWPDSPIGPIGLARSEHGLCLTEFGDRDAIGTAAANWLRRYAPDSPEPVWAPEKLTREVEQLRQYFSGERSRFELELDLRGTPFQRIVWDELCRIPYGEVRSYKEVAAAACNAKAVRAVGGANNRNPVAIIVPCHRVVGADGTLVGYGGGLANKELLLKLEGISLGGAIRA